MLEKRILKTHVSRIKAKGENKKMTDYGYKKCLELGNGIGSKICWNVKPVIRSSPKSIVEALSNGCAKVILDEINNDIYEEFKNMIGDFNMEKCSVVDVNIIVPNKVVEVTFADGTKEKSVCREPDVFSLESAISICISKKIIGGSSAYNNAVKRGMKVYEDKQKKKEAEKVEQKRIEKKRAKRLAYKERRAVKMAEEEKQKKMREREEQITIQTEAYLRAMKAMDDSKNVVVNEENN